MSPSPPSGARHAPRPPAVSPPSPKQRGYADRLCKITGKDSNGAVFTDTYAEGSEITVTTPNGGTTKFKCVNGSWVLQARVRDPRLASVVVSQAQLTRMIG